MPNQPKTPIRGFRIPDGIYEAARTKAAEEGRTISEVVRDLLIRYAHPSAPRAQAAVARRKK